MTVLVSIFLFIVGCGEAADDTEVESIVNSQSSIGAIPDQAVDVGDTMEVEVRVTDLNFDDIHTISSSSDNTDVATVSAPEAILTIKGIAASTATIKVVATDDY